MKPLEVKAERVRKGLSQAGMAQILGMENRTYGAKEAGRNPFTLDESVALAKFFGWDIFQMNEFLFDNKLPLGNVQKISR